MLKNISNTIVESILLEASEKMDLLKNNLDKFDILSQIDLVVAIRKKVFYDINVCDELKGIAAPSKLYCEFVNKVNSLLISIIKCEEVEVEVSRLLLVFSKSHDCDYKTLQQMLSGGKFIFCDIPLLMYLSKKCSEEKNDIEKVIFKSYMDVIVDKLEAIFTTSHFLSLNSSVKQHVVSLYMKELSTQFNLDRFIVMYRSVANPIFLETDVREEICYALQDVHLKVLQYMDVKIKEFVHVQLEWIELGLNFIFDNNFSVLFINNFWNDMKTRSSSCFHIDVARMAREYASIVTEECNLFYADDDGEDSVFFKSVFNAHVNIFINTSKVGRDMIKRNLLREIEMVLNRYFDESINFDTYKIKR